MIELPDSEIHTWAARVEDFDLHQLQAATEDWLTAAERSRLQRYCFDEHKKQLLLGRLLMRTVFSRYEALSFGQWQFCYNQYGKPLLLQSQQDELTAPLYFNLSHSRGALVLAVARLEEIGVDVECNTRARRVEKIASRYFSKSEAKDLLQLEKVQWQERFYDLWSLKESYIKACGMGLAISLECFSFSFPSHNKLAIMFDQRRSDNASCWQFWQLNTLPGFNLALAARSPSGNQIKQLRQFSLKADSVVELATEFKRSS